MGELFGPRSVADWHKAVRTGGAEPESDGSLTLALLNGFPNQYLQEIEVDGTPAGIAVDLPPTPVAYNVYESAPGNRTAPEAPEEETFPPRRETMTLQTPSPVPLGQSWTANQPRVGGTLPIWREGDSRAEATLSKLPAPEVEAAALAGGYEGGLRGVAYELWSEHGRTTASGITYVTLGAGNGLRFFIPDGVRGRATKLGILLTTVGGGQSTLRRQLRVDLDKLTTNYVDLPGPYIDEGAKPALNNESGIGKPAEVKVRGKRVRHRPFVRSGKAHFNKQPGRYRFSWQRVKGDGFSLLAHPSNEIVVDEEEEGEGFYFDPPRDLAADENWLAWVFYTPLAGGVGSWYVMRRSSAERGASHAFVRDEPIPIYGYASDTQPAGLKITMVQSEPPEEDTTALEAPDPTAGPDAPRPIGISAERGQPSTVLIGVAPVDAFGGEGPVSEVVSVTLAALQTYKVRPQPTVGVLKNAEGSERDSTGTPADWQRVNVTAVNSPVAEGAFHLKQATTISTNFPTWRSKPYPVNADTVMVFTGAAIVDRLNQGQAELCCEQYDEADVLQQRIVMKGTEGGYATLGRAGYRMGPGGTAWHANAAQTRYVLRLSIGSDPGCNLDAHFENLQMFPFETNLRKWQKLQAAPANFNPIPATPFPIGADFGVGEPAVPVGSTPESDTPLSHVTFDAASWPAEWVDQSTGAAVESREAAAALHGPNGLRLQDDSTASPKSRRRRRFDAYGAAGGSSLAIRQPVRQVRRPVRASTWVSLQRLHDTSDAIIGDIIAFDDGLYRLRALKSNGTLIQSIDFIAGSEDGSEYDLELLGSGAGTKNGRVAVGVATFGGPREIVAEITGIDLTGRKLRYAWAGITEESDYRTRWTYHIDEVVVTPGGDILSRETPALPSGETPEDPDRPPRLPKNLLTVNQSDVETDTTGFAPVGSVVMSRSTAQKAHGVAALSVSVLLANEGADAYVTPSGIPIKPSTPYTWSFMVYATAATKLDDCRIQEGSGGFRTIADLPFTDLAAGWNYISLPGTTFADSTATARLIMRPARKADGSGWNSTVTLYYDMLQVEQGSKATPWVLGGALEKKNLLTDNQATAETNTVGTSVYFDATVTRVTTEKHSGAASFQVAIPAPDAHLRHGIVWQNATGGELLGYLDHALPAGSWVNFSAWVKAPVGIAFRVSRRATKLDGTGLIDSATSTSQYGKNYVGTGDWQRVETGPHPYFDFAAPWRPVPQITVEQAVGATTFWVDDAQLEVFTPASSDYAAPGNLLTENQFGVETDTTGFSPLTVTMVRSSEVALEGTNSLKVGIALANEGTVSSYVQVLSIFPTPGSFIRAAINVYSAIPVKTWMPFVFETNSPFKSVTDTGALVDLKAGWNELILYGWVPPDTTGGIRVRLFPVRKADNSAWDSTKFLYYDKMRVEEIHAVGDSLASGWTFGLPGTYRETDPDGGAIQQLYLFVPPEHWGYYGPRTTEPIVVEPGETYTVAIQSDHARIGIDADEPSHPARVVLRGAGKALHEAGSLFDGAPLGGLIGSEDWTGTDHFVIFTVPERTGDEDPGYTEAQVTGGWSGPGVYVFQEGLFAKGALATQAERDAARGFAREINGSFRVTVDTLVEHTELTPSFARRFASGGALQASLDLPEGNEVQNVLMRSAPSSAGPWSAEQSDFALVPEDRCFEISGELVGDGREAPKLGEKGAFLELWPSVAMLLDEHREAPPGFAIIGDTPPDYSRGDYDVRTVGGIPFAAKITDDIDRLPTFRFAVFNETAARWALETTPNDIRYIPAPYARGEGRLFRVRLAALLEVPEWMWIMPKILEGERRVEAVFEVPWAFIEESAPLSPPREVGP